MGRRERRLDRWGGSLPSRRWPPRSDAGRTGSCRGHTTPAEWRGRIEPRTPARGRIRAGSGRRRRATGPVPVAARPVRPPADRLAPGPRPPGSQPSNHRAGPVEHVHRVLPEARMGVIHRASSRAFVASSRKCPSGTPMRARATEPPGRRQSRAVQRETARAQVAGFGRAAEPPQEGDPQQGPLLGDGPPARAAHRGAPARRRRSPGTIVDPGHPTSRPPSRHRSRTPSRRPRTPPRPCPGTAGSAPGDRTDRRRTGSSYGPSGAGSPGGIGLRLGEAPACRSRRPRAVFLQRLSSGSRRRASS